MKIKKIIYFLIFLILTTEFLARTVTYFFNYGFNNKTHFISPFFTGNDLPVPVLKDSSGVFNNGKEILYNKLKDEIRIVLIGGSTTKNEKNGENFTISKELNNLLNREFPKITINVLNAGVNEFSSAHSLINFSLRIVNFQPDFLIINHNANDRTANYYGEYVFSDYSNKYLFPYWLGYVHWSGFKGFLIENTKTFRILYWFSEKIRNMFNGRIIGINKVKNVNSGKKYFERNITSILTFARTNSVIPILVTQPHLSLESYKDHIEYNDILEKIAKENNTILINLSKSISNDKENFVDNIHYSGVGIKKISKLIFSDLKFLINDLKKKR